MVFVRVDLSDVAARLNLGPVVDLSGEGTRFELKAGQNRGSDTEVSLGLNVASLLGDNSHLQVSVLSDIVLLGELKNSSGVDATYTRSRQTQRH